MTEFDWNVLACVHSHMAIRRLKDDRESQLKNNSESPGPMSLVAFPRLTNAIFLLAIIPVILNMVIYQTFQQMQAVMMAVSSATAVLLASDAGKSAAS